ncbi:T7SS effector LXG polymorphic toxin [Enterococcus sp. UD-01]|uniref:T7SS effector LXG polymorphic toxin n=1 Tax=Enterococcus sp. UD-01 TaxID=3373911 RepID=UPI00383802B9
MGFHVETAEMKKALEQYQKLSKTAQEQLNSAKKSMNGIINSNAMHGQVGQAIAADINNNKNAVLVGLKNSYKLVEADLQTAYADFASTTGETSQSAILDEAVLNKAKTAIDKFKTEHKEKRQTIKSTYSDIADLIALSMPSSSAFTSACDESKKHLDKIIQKVNEFDNKQQPSSAEEIINALSQQIKMSETASGVSYTDPRFMEFVSQTGLAESIQDIDSQIAKAEADAKLEAEKAAKKKQEQWAKEHPLENALRNFSDGIGSWWNGIVKGTKGLNTEGFFLLETGKGILLALESTVGFVGDGISSLAIGSVQVGQLLGGGIATGINNLRGVKSPDWIGKDWSGTVKNVQALTPSAIFEMSKAAIGAMADDFKRGDIYAMTTDVLTVGTMLTAANGLKNTAKNVTTKLKAPKVGSVVDDVAKGSSGANVNKPPRNLINNMDEIADDIRNINKKYSSGLEQNNSIDSIINSASYYEDVWEQTSAVTRSVAEHAFVDGNKRTAFDTLNMLLDDLRLKSPLNDTQKWDLINRIGTGDLKDVSEIANILKGK